jgi:hypothetical protein
MLIQSCRASYHTVPWIKTQPKTYNGEWRRTQFASSLLGIRSNLLWYVGAWEEKEVLL